MISLANDKPWFALPLLASCRGLAVLATAFGILSAAAPSHAQTFTLNAPGGHNLLPTPALSSLQPRLTVIPHPNFQLNEVMRQSTSASTIPLFTKSIVDPTYGTFTYQMVGQDPSLSSSTTTIPTWVIPVQIVFNPQNVAFNPMVTNPCLPMDVNGQQIPYYHAWNSPLFKVYPFVLGGVNVSGPVAQYADSFQRANFWTQVQGTSYGTVLNPMTKFGLTFYANNFPNPSNTPCGQIGLLDLNTFDSWLQNTVFPFLASYQYAVTPTTFPIFVLENVVFYQGTTDNCCVLGYHSAFNNPSFGGAFQTYAVFDYDSSGAFTNFSDILGGGHEIAEWMDDPSGTNPTPPWGNTGQVQQGCQSNLEVGDPLSQTTDNAITNPTMPNGVVYHVQDLAFVSWFYHQTAATNTGVNGWYSMFGTFKTPAAACGVSASLSSK